MERAASCSEHTHTQNAAEDIVGPEKKLAAVPHTLTWE